MAKRLKRGEFHWFVSSTLNWRASESLATALNSVKKRDSMSKGIKLNGCAIYRVELPMNAEYDIENFAPQVPEAHYVGYEYYKDFYKNTGEKQ